MADKEAGEELAGPRLHLIYYESEVLTDFGESLGLRYPATSRTIRSRRRTFVSSPIQRLLAWKQRTMQPSHPKLVQDPVSSGETCITTARRAFVAIAAYTLLRLSHFGTDRGPNCQFAV
jgi:hypothetical protein